MERRIQVVHLPDSRGIDKSMLVTEIEKFYDKLSAKLPGELFLEAHFKVYNDKGEAENKREQIETKIHARTATLRFNASEVEWDAMKSLKKTFKAIEKETEKAIHAKGK